MLPLAILAGGLATRLGPLTRDLPKCLIEINGKPFIDWQLDLLVDAGYRHFIFCLSYKSEMVQSHLGNGQKWGSHFEYSLDGAEQLGTGGAIVNALPKLGEAFGVIYGDSYLPIDYKNVEQSFEESDNSALMTVYENKGRFDSSNVEFSQGVLINYQKGIHDPRMEYIDYGLTYFKSEALSGWSGSTTFDLSAVCHDLASKGKLGGLEVFERFYEVGSISGIDDLSKYLGKDSE